MTVTEPRVLVPVAVLEGETVPESVVDLLSTCRVVVLGYHVLPEQTAPGQARLQFEERAQTKLDDLAASVRDTGAEAETRLVFTHDEEQTIDRVADETDSDAIVLPNPAPEIGRLLVPIGGTLDVARVAAFVAALIDDRDISVTLLHVSAESDEADAGQSLLDDAAAQLRDRGIPDAAIATERATSGAPIQTIADAATDHDAVVMGESGLSLRSLVFGEASERVAASSLGPVIVVRQPTEEPNDSGSE